MSNGEETVIYLWPDESWVYADEHSDELDRWRGDDFLIISGEEAERIISEEGP